MKNFKKIASAIAALSLAACVAVPMSATVFTASAATTITVDTTNDTEGVTHTYTAYQIFTGTYSEDDDGNKVLSNPGWGSDIDHDALLSDSDFKTLTGLKGSETNVADIIKAIATNVSDKSDNAKKLAQIIAKHLSGAGTKIEVATTVADGYYLIKDTYTGDDENIDSTSLHMLEVVGKPVTINTKKAKPSFEKKLKDVNDSQATDTDGTNPTVWQDGADYDIGDTVPFQLKATLPSDYNEYQKYTLTFHDDFRKSSEDKEVFTFGAIDNVYIDVNANGQFDSGDIKLDAEKSEYTLNGGTSNAADSDNFDVTITNLKEKLASADPVDHDTDEGTPEVMPNVIVEYHATLNENAVHGTAGNWNDAYLEYSNNPNYNGSGITDETDDDEDTTDKTPKDGVVVFTYKTVINKQDQDTKELKGAGFTLYKKYSTTPGETTVAYEKAAADLAEYNISDKNWYEVKAFTAGNDTSFEFTGLDDGDYLLVETKTPEGYNSIDPIPFTITATHDTTGEEPKLSDLSGSKDSGYSGEFTLSPTLNEGKLSADVINQKGATLPSTGGIGTTLFYLGGGALVAVAGVMLITKKRMTKE